jgi:UTP:GlnB (protein PII) uridylyltransferase
VRFHEGFLRGILGESRALLVSPLQPDAICPKDDAIRSLKFILYAKKTVHRLEEVNAWDIIQALIRREPHLITEYEHLFGALSFLEMFRFQLQMFVVQEETFRLDEIEPGQLAQVAARMGYEPIGAVSAWDQLIIDYYRHVKEVRAFCDFMLTDLTRHLSTISLFSGLLQSQVDPGAVGAPEEPLAVTFIQAMRFFLGTRYWVDVQRRLDSDRALLDRFIDSFDDVDEMIRQDVIDEYIGWAEHSPLTIIRFITSLARHQENVVGDTLFSQMNRAFLQYLEQLPYNAERLSRIFNKYPQIIHEYLHYLSDEDHESIGRIMSRGVVDERLSPSHRQMAELSDIHKWSGLYFHRFFSRVVTHHPEYLDALTELDRLKAISSGLLAMVDAYPLSTQRKEALGDYYDLEFLRVGIGTLRGTDLATTNREFTEFCDNYITNLLRVCTSEVEQEYPDAPGIRDSFALLAAGGHAREQAYDDDYDLIALIDTDDEPSVAHATRIVTRMNREILKRGLLPHHRLGDKLGGFVVSLSQLSDYLAGDDSEVFIDLSQLLGARMVAGTPEMKDKLNDHLLRSFIFENKSGYICRMIEELRERRSKSDACGPDACNLKETKGGLRDVEALALILKAFLEITPPISQDFFQSVRSRLPELHAEIDALDRSLYFLRTVRDLYRITVSAEDTVQPDYLWRVANILGQTEHPEWDTTEALTDQLRDTLRESADAGDRVIDYVETATG